MQRGIAAQITARELRLDKQRARSWQGARIHSHEGEMNYQTSIRCAVRRAICAGVSAWAITSASAANAMPQEANDKTSSSDQATELDEVVVTGSRLAGPNMTSTSPIQVVTAEDIKVGGRADISDVINQLPQIFTNTMGQGFSNRTSGLTTPGGVTTAELRGLGPNRTLVLVDGRRLGVGSPNTAIQAPAPDLDQIPAALVDRIDVITGGASATYGSDAVVGVVNFVLKHDFEGLQIDYQTGQNWHSNGNSYLGQLQRDAGYEPLTGSSHDGRSQTATIVAGSNIADGAGNITAYFGYLQNDPVTSGDRDFGACQLFANATLDGAQCGGSVNSNFFQLNGAPASQAYSVVGDQFVLRSDPASNVANPPKVFNSQRAIYMGRDNRRYSGGFLGHVDLNDSAKPYFEFTFMNDRSQQEVAPSALFLGANPLDANGNYNVNCSNPLLSPQQAAVLCAPEQIAADASNPGSVSANVQIGRRNIEGGSREFLFEHTNYRGVAGLRGALGSAWKYDVYGQYFYTTFYNSNDKFLNFEKIGDALQVTGTAADPRCISGSPCVPYNIFRDGAVTQDQLEYLYISGTANGSTTLRTVHADITGSLAEYGVQLPWATDGVGVNVGFENREEQVRFKPDAAEGSGLLSGFGGAQVSIDNTQSVKEGFIEARLPIVQDKSGIKDLTIGSGFRRSDYSTSGIFSTYKVELQYAPVDEYRFRATYQRAIRAPSIVELFNPQVVGQIQYPADPCAPTVSSSGVLIPASASLAQCLYTGVTAAQYGNGASTNTIPQGAAGQLTQVQGGNRDLLPEQGDSYTFGITFNPSFAPGLSGSIDYYDIKLKNLVGTLPATDIFNSCLTTGNPQFCSQLVRSPTTGGLQGASLATGGYIVQTSVNIGGSEIEGVDVQLSYRRPLPGEWGSLNFALNGSLVDKLTNTNFPGDHTYDCAGLFGLTCGRVSPKWRHTLRAIWSTSNEVDLAATWRYLGTAYLDNNDADPKLHFASFGAYNSFNAKLPAVSYLDLSATWRATEKIQVRGGINNIFDKDPPIVTSEIIAGGAANSYEVYDGLGRQLFVGVNFKF